MGYALRVQPRDSSCSAQISQLLMPLLGGAQNILVGLRIYQGSSLLMNSRSWFRCICYHSHLREVRIAYYEVH